MIRLLLGLALAAGLGQAAISVRVLGTTNVQAALEYESPVDEACTVEVSESPRYAPLVHDVNPALFPGADKDTRGENAADGRFRTLVIGKRAVSKGADNKWYSRALQTYTNHYYRIRCGGEVATGSFRTANLPVGVTYPWPIPQDPETGDIRWPSADNNDRSQRIIDPNYGTLIRRVSVPGDSPSEFNDYVKGLKFAKASGANWNNPAGALGGGGATYSGQGRDWLALTDPALSISGYYIGSNAIDSVLVRLRGFGRGASPEERTIEACLTLDGVNCRGALRQATLPESAGEVVLGTDKPIDTWGETLWGHDVNRNKSFGVLIRKANDKPGDIVIESATMDTGWSETMEAPDAGFMPTCSPTKSNGGFHCSWPTNGNANHLYWINPDTGDTRWLGRIVATGWGGDDVVCYTDMATFDFKDPNVFYCGAQQGGKAVLLKGVYTGDDRPASPGSYAKMTWVNLTPAPNTIPDLVKKFSPAYDAALFPCVFSFITGDHAVFYCRRGSQDSIGWVAVYHLGDRTPTGTPSGGRIVAAADANANRNTRWCGLHTMEFFGHTNWIGWVANSLRGGGPGSGPYSVVTQTPVQAATGQMTVRVSGEPLVGTDPQSFLMAADVGDMFQFGSDWDYLRIVRKTSPTEWVVDRYLPFGAPPPARPAGQTLTAICRGQNLIEPTLSPDVYWNFEADPRGQDVTDTKWVVEKTVVGGHRVDRPQVRIMENYTGYHVIPQGIPNGFNKEAAYRVILNPRFDGVRAGTGLDADGLGNIYQQHPSFENYLATEPGRNNWFVDFIALAGHPGMTHKLELVAGHTQVYKALSPKLHRDQFPTFALCGGRQLKEITSGPIRDQDGYSFCVGSSCVQGAGQTDVFINCPAPVSTDSACWETPDGNPRQVCVGDMAPYGQTITQFYLDPSGRRNRVLTNGLFAWNSARRYVSLDTASPLPDGSWVVFPSFGNNARKDIYMVKVPPQPEFPADPNEGSGFIDTSIEVNPPPGPTEQVVFKYGSALAAASDPQFCRPGSTCAFNMRARPLEVIVGKAVFRNGNGENLGESRTEVKLTTGSAGAGIGAPAFQARAVVNAASYEQKLAPGGAVAIFGQDLANCEASAQAFPLPETLCDARVTFNNQPGRFYAAGPGQLSVVMPASVAPGQDIDVVIERAGAKSETVRIPGSAVTETAPALYFFQFESALARAVVQMQDLFINGPNRPELKMRPLRRGEAATLYANGLGKTNPAVGDGEETPREPLSQTVAPVDVYVNGVRQTVTFAGLTPSASGLYQINFQVSADTPLKGKDQDQIWITINGAESPRLAVTLE